MIKIDSSREFKLKSNSFLVLKKINLKEIGFNKISNSNLYTYQSDEYKVLNYSNLIYDELNSVGVRVSLNNRSDKIGAKIRQAELEKINVMLIIGEKEVEEKKISVRRRFEGNTGTIGIDELKLELIKEIKTRSLSHRKETATTT